MKFFRSMIFFLILANLIVFIFEYVYPPSIDSLALTPTAAINHQKYWQFISFMFVHADLTHILLNMWGLFLFGPAIEQRMGSIKFLLFYLITGISSGLFHILLEGIGDIPLVGASGAVFGVMTAYGLFFPMNIIYFQLFIPMPAIVFIIFIGVLQLIYGIGGLEPGVANYGHLGGMLVGFILVKFFGFGKRKVRYIWE